MSEISTSEIRVRWSWSWPPFRASFQTPKGSTVGVLRWTPWAARWRAEELQDHWNSYSLRKELP